MKRLTAVLAHAYLDQRLVLVLAPCQAAKPDIDHTAERPGLTLDWQGKLPHSGKPDIVNAGGQSFVQGFHRLNQNIQQPFKVAGGFKAVLVLPCQWSGRLDQVELHIHGSVQAWRCHA